MPKSLIQSTDCNDRCSQVLDAKIISGDRPSRVKSSYIAGSRFAFSIELEFDRSYFGSFKVQIMIKPSLGSRYFSGVNISNPLEVDINPAYLAIGDREDKLR